MFNPVQELIAKDRRRGKANKKQLLEMSKAMREAEEKYFGSSEDSTKDTKTST